MEGRASDASVDEEPYMVLNPRSLDSGTLVLLVYSCDQVFGDLVGNVARVPPSVVAMGFGTRRAGISHPTACTQPLA